MPVSTPAIGCVLGVRGVCSAGLLHYTDPLPRGTLPLGRARCFCCACSIATGQLGSALLRLPVVCLVCGINTDLSTATNPVLRLLGGTFSAARTGQGKLVELTSFPSTRLLALRFAATIHQRPPKTAPSRFVAISQDVARRDFPADVVAAT